MPNITESQLKRLREQYPDMAKISDKFLVQYALAELSELKGKQNRKHPELPSFLK